MSKFLFRRYLLFCVALFINALGIAFITRAALGTSPITSVTYVLSMFTPFTIGEWTIMLNILFVVLEPFMMTRQDLKDDLRMYLLQIPISFCFGIFIDICMHYILFWLNPATYPSMIIALLIGCVILAVGIALEVKANAAMLSGEYIVKVITKRFHGEFGYVKLGFDITLAASACLLSLIFMSGVYGVREGTVVAALIVGPIVHFVSPYYAFLDKWIAPAESEKAIGMKDNKNVIITIAREYGSGGHQLGEMLSKELGIKEFIGMDAKRSGMDERYIAQNEQSIPSFWLKCILSKSSEQTLEGSISSDDVLFVAESKIIEELAEKESCIIVGRCADYILKDYPKVLKVFCYSDMASAISRCTAEYGINKENAETEIRRINRNRIHHYEYYTGMKWGEPHHYNLMINTGSIGLETACRLVKDIYRKL
ncbi:cytidylate kinase family protein [Bacteroides sp.]|uniref:cytidylate kinase family protein n=1 Tax=Bacteroides sp. TaxID=29523 RepID=UPI0025C66664|nr:cytidylate kinase family protein [Bacteroides sp.]